MHGSGRRTIRVCHGVALVALTLVFGALMMARANWKELRADLHSSLHLYASLKPDIPFDESLLESVRSLAGIASVRVVDAQTEQGEPFIVEIKPQSPFSREGQMEALEQSLRGTGIIEDVVAPLQARDRIASLVAINDRIFLAAVVTLVSMFFLVCAPLEYLRFRADNENYGNHWLADRLILAIVACIVGAGSAALIGAWIVKQSHGSIVFYNTEDLLLLLVVCLVSPLTWAFVLHAWHHAPQATSATRAPFSDEPTDPPPVAGEE